MLTAKATAPSSARAHAQRGLQDWGFRELDEDVGLVVSELVTNAVRASARLQFAVPVRVWLGSDERLVLVAWPMPALSTPCGWSSALMRRAAVGWRWWRRSAAGGAGTRSGRGT
jgi:hypothetical protein